MRRVGVEWWNTHCFKGDSPTQMYVILKILDGRWIERDYDKLRNQWPMLEMTYSYEDIGNVVKCSTIIRELFVNNCWRIGR